LLGSVLRQRWEAGQEQRQACRIAQYRVGGVPVLAPIRSGLSVQSERNDSLRTGIHREADRPAPGVLVGIKRLLAQVQHPVVDKLAYRHDLPGEVAQAIQHHHDPIALEAGGLDERPARMVALGQLAEHILFQGTGRGKTAEWAKLGSACLAVLGIDEAAADALAAEAVAESAWEADR